ncbi:hypothetical protein RBB78_18875 [Tunturiibacter empetritectus]|uniref:hypothetical protein n=1 Tax=Tunturiibacter empetritectus TaxID=3069691 RepID=UPI003D9B548C
MMGCCSLTSQDAEMGHAVYESLRGCMVEPALLTVATAPFRLPAAKVEMTEVRAPKLLRAYLTIGAKICSELGDRSRLQDDRFSDAAGSADAASAGGEEIS